MAFGGHRSDRPPRCTFGRRHSEIRPFCRGAGPPTAPSITSWTTRWKNARPLPSVRTNLRHSSEWIMRLPQPGGTMTAFSNLAAGKPMKVAAHNCCKSSVLRPSPHNAALRCVGANEIALVGMERDRSPADLRAVSVTAISAALQATLF